MRVKATLRPDSGRTKKCRTCRGSFPAGRIVNGECPSCAGLTPLLLRGSGGKFLPGLASAPSCRGRRDRVAVLALLLMVLPVLVLADCEGPMFPDGVIPPRAAVAEPFVGLLVLLVGVVAVMAWR